MTPFCSIALFSRNGSVVFKPPRKERPVDITQARKSAMRHWRGRMKEGEKLLRVVIVREVNGLLEVSECAGRGKPWYQYTHQVSAAISEPHIAAAVNELGVDADKLPPPMPDVIEINGFTYRRDI